MSQQEVAELVDLDTKYFGRLEGGFRKLSLENIERIAAALNVHYVVLLIMAEGDDPTLSEIAPLAFRQAYKGVGNEVYTPPRS